ncbi:hypothetical protein I4U30_21875 [Enterobacter asburiae]|uniref:hypothetical protein n=1 Tax=Enterobacter asburiae TaxID=61645 RepID=UPI00192BC3AF|nr:hypothetical protein [Enterobacter asburiae]MBL5840919.1 hypothetical protein [Enterobacter asburiae]
MDIQIPDCNDDEWMREQFRALRERIESSYEEKHGSDLGDTLHECLQILNALQEYAGY